MISMKSARSARQILATVVLLSLGGACVANANAATPRSDVPTVVVKYGDLNVATDAGAKALYRRIVLAARAVCPDADVRDFGVRTASMACQNAAISRAIASVPSAPLAAIFAARDSHS
jgi:UrcA family protein